MLEVDQLPDDPAILKRLLVERDTQLAERDARIDRIRQEATEQMESLRQRMEAEKKAEIEAAIKAILKRYYGPRSERFDPTQLLLFGLKVEETPIDEQSIAEESGEELVTRRVAKRHKHGRNPLPDHLPRIEILHDLKDEEKPCPCCGELRHRIGEEVSEQLEYMPASFKVLKHVRVKYACGRCEHDGYNPQIVAAAKPPQPIEKGLPGPGLLAYVITSKLGDHLPLYRLEHIFQRQQLSIARSTMAAWLAASAELVRPLVERMSNRVRASKVVHTDDTRVPIQSPGEGKCRNGRIWAYIGDRANPYVVYDYTPDRTRAGPTNWLRGFKGFLQADAYGGYDGIYHGGSVTEVACWAHARRKFFDAKETDGKRAAQMLSMVRELYAVEEQAKEFDDTARRELRQAQSVAVLERIKSVRSASPTAGELELGTAESWGRPNTLADHFGRHGADFGAQTADEYAGMASKFLQEGQAGRFPTKIGPDGTIRVYDPATNTFGSFNANGTTKTFYKPNPAEHGYPTNLDYWNAQKGVPPWVP